MDFTLYHYWRSSCSWRVRWALELKGIAYESVPVNLLKGEQLGEAHRARNPIGQVPVLVVDGTPVADSIAIIELLDEVAPGASFLPKAPLDRAKVRRISNLIASGIQPLQNLATMNKVSTERAESVAWSAYWIRSGLEALELTLKETAGAYAFGESITMADLCLIPQCYNAERFKIDLGEMPIIEGIYRRSRALDSCKRAAPEAFDPSD